MAATHYYNFNPGLPEPFNVIHPFQLKSVMAFVKSDFPDEVERIILFGGSLDLACGKYSDLDLYVIIDRGDPQEVYDKIHALLSPLKKRFDVLVSHRDDFAAAAVERGTVEFKIKQKGVCIYAK